MYKRPVFVPDLNINTEGGTLAEALDMARDAISIWGITEQDAGRTIPEASDTMPTAAGGQIVQRVDVDFEAYRRDATAYPACFYKENDGYSVIFPDLNYLATQGDGFGDDMRMAAECLAGYMSAAQRDGDAIPAPVSYTHLDVYKRQLLAGEDPCGYGRKDHPQDLDHHGNTGRRRGLPDSPHHLLLCLSACPGPAPRDKRWAVSYTHLDVYKRQGQHLPAPARGRGDEAAAQPAG